MVKRMEEHHTSLLTEESMREKHGELLADMPIRSGVCDLPLETREHAQNTSSICSSESLAKLPSVPQYCCSSEGTSNTPESQLFLPSSNEDCRSTTDDVAVSSSDALPEKSFMTLVDDSDSDAASVNYIDDLSTMAELRLEECSIDSCSLNSHTLGEIERDCDITDEKEIGLNFCEEQIEIGSVIRKGPEAKVDADGNLFTKYDNSSELLVNTETCSEESLENTCSDMPKENTGVCSDELVNECSDTFGKNNTIDTKDVGCDTAGVTLNNFNNFHPEITTDCKSLALQTATEDCKIAENASRVEGTLDCESLASKTASEDCLIEENASLAKGTPDCEGLALKIASENGLIVENASLVEGTSDCESVASKPASKDCLIEQNASHTEGTPDCEGLASKIASEDGLIADNASLVEGDKDVRPKRKDSSINSSINSVIDIENGDHCLNQEGNVASVNRSEKINLGLGTAEELPVHTLGPETTENALVTTPDLGTNTPDVCCVKCHDFEDVPEEVCVPLAIYENVKKPKRVNIGSNCPKSVTFCDDLKVDVDSSEERHSEDNVDEINTELMSDDDYSNLINDVEDDGEDSDRTLDCSADDASEHFYESINYESVPEKKKKSPDSRSSRSSRSSHSSTVSSPWAEERLYEDIVDLRSPTEAQNPLNDGEDLPFFSRRLQVHRQFSSSDSWGSEDLSYSSNEDEEKTLMSHNNSPENFKQRLLRKREQWRERRQSSRNLKFSLRKDQKDPKDSKDTSAKENDAENADTSSITENKENRLYRWFSLRKSNYDVERKSNTFAGNPEKGGGGSSYTMTNGTPSSSISNALHLHHRMPRLIEEQEGSLDNRTSFDPNHHRRHQPPALPPMPQGLSPEQIKRRHIVSSIVHSENNYVATLHRLVNDFKKPLEESKPPILSSNKLSTLFYRVTEILDSHTLFRIALTECVRQWDKEEKIGDVFVASFTNAIVLDVYSDFINNFSRAMDVAKQESKKKSAFADFLKMRQITSNDRLSFFGLMVKPVQRFPQFILFLQDLLKHTPKGHHDRMSLQLALTQLESLAEMLNERKREAEQYQAFRDTLKHINTKFALRSLGDGNRYLLRQDNATQLEFNQSGMITKTKDRRLFLTNDLVICVSVVPKSGDDFFQHGERLSLKWAYPVADVEISDTSSSPTLSRLLAAGMNKSGSMSSRIPEESLGANKVESLVQEMNDLMHDYETLSRITALVASLKGAYEGLSLASVQQVGSSIQRAIHQKDEQMVWIDSCCLQFSVKTKEGRDREIFTFQTDNPTVKKDWIVELRLAQLALDKTNSPAWDLPDHERTPSTKLPLFVKSLPVFSSKHQTEVKCGCCYTIMPNRQSRSTGRQMMYLWLCSSDGVSSHLTIFHMQQVGLRELVKVDLTEMCVSALQHVPALGTGTSGGNEDIPLRSHTVWMGTDSHRLLVYSGLDPEKQTELSSSSVPAAITTIKYHCDQVYVGLSNGIVQVYRRGIEGAWLLDDPIGICLGTLPVTALLPISTHIYASCGNQVYVVDCFTAHVAKQFGVNHEDSKGVFLMAHSGIGLWIAQEQSSTICLYHTETFRHLQDINVASNVSRMLSETGNTQTPAKIFVTALIASKGLLWVGTNVGVALTIPLPRLEGIPIISGRANISFHAHLGPITFLLALQSQSGRPTVTPPPPDPRLNSHELSHDGQQFHPDGRSSTVPPTPTPRIEKQQSDTSMLAKKMPQSKLKQQMSSPVMLRRRSRESREQSRRLSKTLPRTTGGMTLSGSQECDVYGLCGALLNVQNYEEDSLGPQDCSNLNLSRYDSMRRSDPELALPEQLSTLDRRLRLKASRPRSLDLSTWSVDSRASSACTTVSSGSEESAGGGMSPSVSKRQTNGTPQHPRTGTTGTFSKRKEGDQNRTLMVVVGGRGYINWQRSENGTAMVPPNTKDAHIIVWEMKL